MVTLPKAGNSAAQDMASEEGAADGYALNFPHALVGTGSPGAGGAGALPATPAGYLQVNINGRVSFLPYY